MLTRRGFLIGSSQLLTAAFVERAVAFVQAEGAPLLVPPSKATTTLMATWSVDEDCYILTDGKPTEVMPPTPTWREFLRRRKEPTTAEEIDDNWGLTADRLDEPVSPGVWADAWLDFGTPESRAYDLLADIHLGPKLRAAGRPHVRFHEGGMIGATGRWVTVPDDLSLSLLQARLVELGASVSL